ncbi:peptide chain release factor N(5)-glutamine methyltransferase [Flagellimonas sp. HMM57]|uniref:peptide chain release factor N(5)-glutamine methyltransferase n=1 Tax=unclassified Flagellimonas TaxID=2644544 RepID=UPI0013D39110|nr:MULTISPECIES: peptide chain release factor N(5)-glutamine methyltransferase [unclassified Flagellimonas]UII75583.1 peptide chain release factor N(5)-glutamine methyltransferase [Flagellimonas sp. HMM57]
MLLKEIKTIFHKELDKLYPNEEVDAFFYQLIEHYLQLERFVLVLQPNVSITKEEEQPLFEALAQLKLEKPLQYILGTAYFMDMEFKVNEHVLIPRPETEELVEWIILDNSQDAEQSNPDAERSRSVISTKLNDRKSDLLNDDQGLKILDIGTGSGCIAIALAKKLPNAKVFAIDISEKALEVATQNAQLNEVEVTFIKADILNFELELELNFEFDIIVSNPPYVRELEKEHIKKNVKDYEPNLALFVPDEDALLFYRAITKFTQRYLSKTGSIYLEINQYLGEETKLLLEAHNFSEIELRKDIFGNDRMLKGKLD